MEVIIYCGNNRQTKVWKEQKTTFEELCEKLRTPIRTSETSEEYRKMKKVAGTYVKEII